jgi:hypothetical protein
MTTTRDVMAYRIDVQFAMVRLFTGPNNSHEVFVLPATNLSIDGVRSTVGQVATPLFTGEVAMVRLTIDAQQHGRVIAADFRK